jgi:chromosome segregation ATPase
VELTWEIIEAVADVCFPDDSAEETAERLAPAKRLWTAAQKSPTPLQDADVAAAVTRELLDAKDRTIAAYEEIDRARQAYQASERGRHQALQAATLVFALLGQAQAKIAELTRQVDALQARPVSHSAELESMQHRLQRAREQEKDIRAALATAEEERDIAQRVADHAARRIDALEAEIAVLKAGTSEAVDDTPTISSASLLVAGDIPSVDPADAVMDDVDRALDKVRAVLQHEHEAVQEAAEEVGWHAAPPPTYAGLGEDRIIKGHVLSSTTPPPTADREDQGIPSELSGTTPTTL